MTVKFQTIIIKNWGVFFNQKNTFYLLVAPPAWGKTRFLKDLYVVLQEKRVVYISPLRALAREVYGQWQGINSTLFYASSRQDLQAFTKNCRKWKNFFLIATPEVITENFWQELEEKSCCFILDEFHLFYEWGAGFRPILQSFLVDLITSQHTVYGMSATISPKIIREIRFFYSDFFQKRYLFNFGNFELLKKPHSTKLALTPQALEILLLKVLSKGERGVLIFCQYRQQVNDYYKRLKRRKISVVKCRGGEVEKFTRDLAREKPQVIIATSVLSHGVNLPQIKHIFFFYREKREYMKIQMIARGGRQGEEYFLYGLKKKRGIGQKVKDFFKKKLYYFFHDSL